MNQGGFRYLQSLRRGDQIGSFPARWQRCGIQPGEVKLRSFHLPRRRCLRSVLLHSLHARRGGHTRRRNFRCARVIHVNWARD